MFSFKSFAIYSELETIRFTAPIAFISSKDILSVSKENE